MNIRNFTKTPQTQKKRKVTIINRNSQKKTKNMKTAKLIKNKKKVALESRTSKRTQPVFLPIERENYFYALVLGNYEVALDVQSGPSFHFIFIDGKVRCMQIPEMKSNQEEADSKIVRHAIAVHKSDPIVLIVVKAHDRDPSVI